MSDLDYEREYDNRGRVPEHPAIIEGWYLRAAAARRTLGGRLDVPYAEGERTRLDLFEPTAMRGPAVVFFHGGYWQSQDKSGFSHLALGPLAHGLPVAIAGYDLCPAVPLETLIEQARAATRFVANLTGRPVLVAGHSAGGHLAACVAATPGLPVEAVLALSGLFDLRPLVETSVNAKLGLDATRAAASSPITWPAPAGLPVELVVGEWESSEYHRQSRELAARWGERVRYTSLAGAHHFTVIEPLADPTSDLVLHLATFGRDAP
ncbi:MAG: alpha/beta hydrolase [Pseudomonadota bacterium]